MNNINYLLSIESKGIKLGLDRTYQMMAACENPHVGLPAIQVVGTNGKGSVCSILASIMKAANYKVGLFTSPHLVRINERIRINGKPILDSTINEFLQIYKKDIEKIDASFFEVITTLACWFFKKENVDIAIMETGLGGRLDSTTVCESIITVITPISLDHIEILGDTIEKIAFEKAGAMKNNILCISAKQKPSVIKVLKSEANKKNTPIYFIDNINDNNIDVNIAGQKQKENTQLSLSVIDKLNSFNIPHSAIKKGLKEVQWHGRNQMINNNPMILFDVAHNSEGFKSFLNYYQTLKINGNSILIIALYSKKNIQDIVPNIESCFDHIICTETKGRSPMCAKNLYNHFNPNHSVEIIYNPSLAIKKGIDMINSNGGMAILGTHCLGPYINEIFKISFDIL
tara:strand:- start:6595 stop:7797 length:1203 start_codon:yes stop_codon:yes gene_type:complete